MPKKINVHLANDDDDALCSGRARRFLLSSLVPIAMNAFQIKCFFHFFPLRFVQLKLFFLCCSACRSWLSRSATELIRKKSRINESSVALCFSFLRINSFPIIKSHETVGDHVQQAVTKYRRDTKKMYDFIFIVFLSFARLSASLFLISMRTITIRIPNS